MSLNGFERYFAAPVTLVSGLFGDEPERLRAAAGYVETVEQCLRWRELAPAEKVEYLLAHLTISDRSWTDEPRQQGEKREAFIRRVLLGDVTQVTAMEEL